MAGKKTSNKNKSENQVNQSFSNDSETPNQANAGSDQNFAGDTQSDVDSNPERDLSRDLNNDTGNVTGDDRRGGDSTPISNDSDADIR